MDKADEIAREIVLDYIPDDREALQEALAAEIARALRSYVRERVLATLRRAQAEYRAERAK